MSTCAPVDDWKPLVSKQRAKGTAAETAVVRYLQANGFPYAERRALHGTADKGDITGCGPLVFEVKNHKEFDLSGWMNELMRETDNAQADYGVLVVKRRGHVDAANWYAVMPFEAIVALLKQAGY